MIESTNANTRERSSIIATILADGTMVAQPQIGKRLDNQDE
jgi:hypothetical protein